MKVKINDEAKARLNRREFANLKKQTKKINKKLASFFRRLEEFRAQLIAGASAYEDYIFGENAVTKLDEILEHVNEISATHR